MTSHSSRVHVLHTWEGRCTDLLVRRSRCRSDGRSSLQLTLADICRDPSYQSASSVRKGSSDER